MKNRPHLEPRTVHGLHQIESFRDSVDEVGAVRGERLDEDDDPVLLRLISGAATEVRELPGCLSAGESHRGRAETAR